MTMATTTNDKSAEAIQVWLTDRLAAVLNISPDAIDSSESFDRYGLDSLAAITLTGDLEEWLDCELPVTLAWDYPTIELLSAYLAELVA